MKTVFKLPTAYIPKASLYQDEFLTIPEFKAAVKDDHIKVQGKKFIKGKRGHGRLRLYLADDPKNISRGVQVEFAAYSSYGVSKYAGEEDVVEKEPEQDKKEDKKEKKKRETGWSITYSVDENPKLLTFTDEIDKLVADLVKSYLPKIYDDLCGITDPADYPVTTFRKSARASGGSPIKYFRLTIPVGRTEFGPETNLEEFQSLDDFPQNTAGRYRNVALLSHIDVSYKDGVVSIGPIVYAKMIRTTVSKEKRKRKFRDNDEEDSNQ